MVARKSWAVNQVSGTGQITVEDARLTMGALWTPTGQITSRTGLAPAAAEPGHVTATTPTPNGLVHVAPFRGVIQSSRGGGTYTICTDAITDIDILGTAPADPSNPRNDLIVFQQSDTYFSDANSNFVVRHVVGTPAGSPVDPTVTGSADYVVKARIVVPANTTDIETADITNFDVARTVAVGGVLPVRSATERTAITSPYTGMEIFREDKGWREFRNASAWRVPPMTPVGALADVTDPYTGLVVVLTTENIAYRWTGSAWVASFPVGAGVTAEYRQTGSGQSLTTGTDTIISFDTAIETSTWITRTVSGVGHYFALGLAGRWVVTANLRIAAGGSDAERAMSIASDAGATGASRWNGDNQHTAAVAQMNSAVTKKFPLNQRVAVWGFQTSGSSRTLDNGIQDNRIQLTWLGE